MRLLITGASGLLGGNLALIAAAAGHEVFAAYGRHPVAIAGCQVLPLDLTSRHQVDSTVVSIRPEVVVHAAAMANPDACEADPRAAWQINVEATDTLAGACQRAGSRLVYISTDLVFDGKRGMYTEHDPPVPISTYGLTKLEAERRVLDRAPGICVVRSALIYGWSIRPDKPGFLGWVLDSLRAGRPVKLFVDQYRTPILANDECGAILDLCGKGLGGLYHLGGPQRISRYDFGRALARTYGFGDELLIPTPQDDIPRLAPRPRDCSLNIVRARAALDVPVLDIAAGLRRLKQLEDTGYIRRLRSETAS